MTEGMRKAADAGRERVEAAKEAVGERVEAAREATAQRMEATGERVEAAKAAAGERVEAAKAAAVELQQKVKPKLRGVVHEFSFPVSLLAGGLLVFFASGGPRAAGARRSTRSRSRPCSGPAPSTTASTGARPPRGCGCADSTTR